MAQAGDTAQTGAKCSCSAPGDTSKLQPCQIPAGQLHLSLTPKSSHTSFTKFYRKLKKGTKPQGKPGNEAAGATWGRAELGWSQGRRWGQPSPPTLNTKFRGFWGERAAQGSCPILAKPGSGTDRLQERITERGEATTCEPQFQGNTQSSASACTLSSRPEGEMAGAV